MRLLICGLLLAALAARPAAARQEADPRPSSRFGVGAGLAANTADGLGAGLWARASAPLSADLSFAIDLGMAAYTAGAAAFEPQVSVIITLPAPLERPLPYLVGGIGGYFPFMLRPTNSGATLHAGLGWVRPGARRTWFVELTPTAILGRRRVDLLLPVRLGTILEPPRRPGL